jgi:copper chaperone CopZ
MEKSSIHTYHIDGMSCGGCESTVKNKLSAVAGVTLVKVDLGKKEAEITSSPAIKLEALKDVLSNTHYAISEISA